LEVGWPLLIRMRIEMIADKHARKELPGKCFSIARFVEIVAVKDSVEGIFFFFGSFHANS